MKKILLTAFGMALYVLIQKPLGALTNESLLLYLDLGGLRDSYFYPVMDLGCSAKGLFGIEPLKLDGRVRSYGTYFLFNPYSYDFTLLGSYSFPVYLDNLMNIQTFAGLGLDIRLRLSADERSTAVSSAEPVLACGMEGVIGSLGLALPLWTRFYSDGISLQILPEISWRWGWFGVFIRSELAYLTRIDKNISDWNWNNFAGIRVMF